MKPKFFKTPSEFRKWLAKNHDKETEIWVGFFKKASGKIGINYDQALDEVLSYGWIDGIVKSFNEEAYMQRYTPRLAKSNWSKINREHVVRLTKEGRMMPSGLKVVESAKEDGRWQAAYDSPANSVVPEEFLSELKKNKKAEAFFKTLNKTNIYAICYRLQTAKKPETKQKRIKDIIEKLSKEEKFY